MTATPRYFTGRVKKEAKEADLEVASMDEKEKFGPVVHRLTFGDAIEQELLSDYRVVVVGVTDSEALDLATRGAFVTHDGQAVTDARTLARQIGLLRAMARYDLRRVVTFHSRIIHAARFAASLLDTNRSLPTRRRPSGELWTDHVSGKMTAGERDVRLRRLGSVRQERGVLTNARCLTEGVDVPTLDCVAFIDPRRSQVDVVQAVGRAIRKAEDKALGYIVVPVLVDADSDPAEAVESSEFDRVWEVVRGLRDHDEDLADELDELRRELGRRGSIGRRPGKIVLDLPTAIGTSFFRVFDAKLVEATSAKWEVGFGHLQGFVAREGHARVPRVHDENGYALGNWIGLQRRRYRRGLLSAARIALLEALPNWTWNEQASRWEEAFALVEGYVAREGHARMRHDHVEAGFPLGKWISNQRDLYRGRKSQRDGKLQLHPDRAARLMALPDWTWDEEASKWDESYARLKRFVAREGHARPKFNEHADGHPLGDWVLRQRRQYRRGVLTPERIARLEALPGWQWRLREESRRASWEESFLLLQRFAARTGHVRAPSQHNEDGVYLWRWVYGQRQAYRADRLTAEQIARLEALPGWTWDTRKKER